MAAKLVEHLRSSGLPCEGINCFTMTEAPLRWGEAIPIWYLQKALSKLNQGKVKKLKSPWFEFPEIYLF